MRQCERCDEIKFWFQFYSSFEGLYTAVTDICNKCANELKREAVFSYKPKKLNANNLHRLP